MEVVAQAGDAEDLLRKVRAHKPDVAIVDIRMPPGDADDGLQAAKVIRSELPDTGVLVLSQYAGGSALDPEVVTSMVGRKEDPLQALTPREREVLELMAQGLSNKAICEHLFLSERAVERHITGVLSKLGIPTTGQEHRRVLAVLAFLGG